MWFTLAILSYLFLALTAFLDKYILGGPLPSPKIYSFYTGILSLLVLLLIPIGFLVSFGFLAPLRMIFPETSKIFLIPNLPLIILSLTTGIIAILFLFFYYKGVQDFEISRIGPAVGGITPLFILGIIYFFTFISSGLGFERRVLAPRELLALILLILGSVILTLHRDKLATLGSLKASFIASFFLGLSFVLSKIVYKFLGFWPGFIWIGIGQFSGAMFFLFFHEVRNEVFSKRGILGKKIAFPFIFAKGIGGLGSILQNRAIFLAPVVFLPVINALSGVQYIFLIILATLLFFKFPGILKEEISRKVLLQKAIAVCLVVMGLVFLSSG